ncbi:hypothetical protein OUZ56_003470 [Daphnia magna]|uniref:Uncharacterized protein n=1 Tax=Daphnia magna TaxID=35525 RepID=A0ABR0A8T5_9CRUS|nr:hypothetical protein OUZ56_003470 [Daphnia magna]
MDATSGEQYRNVLKFGIQLAGKEIKKEVDINGIHLGGYKELEDSEDEPNDHDLLLEEGERHRTNSSQSSLSTSKSNEQKLGTHSTVYQEYTKKLKEAREVRKSKSRSTSSNEAIKAKRLKSNINFFPYPSMTDREQKVIYRLIVNFIIDEARPLQAVESIPFQAMFNTIQYNSSIVPEEFKGLVVKIDSEIVLADTERIVRQHNIGVNKSATRTVCASSGMRAFDMGTVHHTRIPITQLDVLKCTIEQKSVIEKTEEEFRWLKTKLWKFLISRLFHDNSTGCIEMHNRTEIRN